MEYMEFFNRLKTGDIANLYLFYGQEEYIKDQAVAQLKDALIPPAVQELNMTVIDGESASVDDILAAAETLPVFNHRRLIAVRNYAGLVGHGSSGDAATRRLIGYMSRIPEYLCLVFVCRGDIPKNTALFKALSQHGVVIDFAPLKDKDLILWIRTAFKRLGKAISPQDAQYMALMAGTELEVLDQEIRKVSAYATDSSVIAANHIDAVVTRTASANIFKMVDAIGQRDSDKALMYINELVEMGQSPIGMLAMIARQFRLLLQCKLLLDKRCDVKEIAAQVKLPLFVVRGYIAQLKAFTKEQLVYALKSCLQADLAMKSSSVDQSIILEKLVLILKNNGI